MEFNVSELEREPIDFDLELGPGAVGFGQEAEQVGNLATSGLAEVLHEHRHPAQRAICGHISGSLRPLRGAG